ncbi:MAG: MFS transporter [Acidimicrobiales bacterium]
MLAGMRSGPDDHRRRELVPLLAVSTGLAVASVYYAQPLLPFIGRDLHLSAVTASLVVTLSQAGFALGLLCIVPLGDLVERRGLVTGLVTAAAVALAWLGASTSAASLLPAAVAVGITSVTAQVLVPFAASLAGDEDRGRVLGRVMSGLLLGILLARTVAALLAEAGTWRLVYFVAAGALLVQAAVLRWRLPAWREQPGLSYPKLVRSVGTLVRREPLLRLRALYGLLLSAAFNALWTSVAFLLDHHYHFSLVVIGLFGLAGAGGVLAASLAGRLSDRGRAAATTGVAAALLVVSWAALWAGSSFLGLLVAGIVVLDVGAQGLHITNQGEIYGRLDPRARSRVTSAYMIAYFVGAAAGSQLSATAYGALGWDGVCLVGGAFSVAALLVWATMTAARWRGAGRPLLPTGPG